MKRRFFLFSTTALSFTAALPFRSLGDSKLIAQTSPSSTAVTVQEAYEIGKEAYYYLYPLVLTDLTRRISTNIEAGIRDGYGPMNQFSHIRAFPDASFRVIVRPNFDTLYSNAWLDLTQEPMIVSAPDTQGRYYLLPMLDLWTDVFAVPGRRTSGTAAGNWAVVPKGWQGQLPAGVERIEAPTPYVWIAGRTQTNGSGDYAAVHQVQDSYKITPLSQWGKPPKPVRAVIDPTLDMQTEPLRQVNSMSAAQFFSYASELMKLHPPHITDWSQIARLRRIGVEPGKSFNLQTAPVSIQQALNRAAVDALQIMIEKQNTIEPIIGGWRMGTEGVGVFGNSYLKRAVVALRGLGINQPEDAIYPGLVTDAAGQPVEGSQNYVLHFDPGKLPPVDAFWSVTMYDAEGFPVPNSLNRYALGDRDNLKFNADGSLDIYIQSSSPGADQESNWLPSPAQGRFGAVMRLYAPRAEVRDGRWVPTPVQRVL